MQTIRLHFHEGLMDEANESSFTAWPSCSKDCLISVSPWAVIMGMPIKFMNLVGGHEITGAVIEYHIIPNWAPDPVCELKMSPDRTGWMGAGSCLLKLARAQFYYSCSPPYWIAWALWTEFQVSLIIKVYFNV